VSEFQVNNETILIYHYLNDTSRSIEANSISPDGTTYTTTGNVRVEDYAGKLHVHFYSGPNVIIKYVGNNTEIISTLEKEYGNQFAGAEHS
jgi:hypothetical protein